MFVVSGRPTHLHRHNAPISDDAWDALDEEAAGYLRHYLAARRLIEIAGPSGRATAAMDTGRIDEVDDHDLALELLEDCVAPERAQKRSSD